MYSSRLEQSAMASGGVRDLNTLGGGQEGEPPRHCGLPHPHFPYEAQPLRGNHVLWGEQLAGVPSWDRPCREPVSPAQKWHSNLPWTLNFRRMGDAINFET